MPQYFRASIAAGYSAGGVVTVEIDLGPDRAANTEIVPAAVASFNALNLPGGPGIHFDGPATLPAAMALAHCTAHKFGYVACFDPKLGGYVVAVSHDPNHHVGQLIPKVR